MDCLLDALTDLRAQGHAIPLYDADRRECWFDGLAQLIAELRAEDQRMAWVTLVADDLCRRMPGLPLSMAAGPLLDRLRAMEASRHADRI